MNDIAIQVENVSKLYHIGKRRTYKTARESLMNTLSAPARLARKLAGRVEQETDETALWALKDVSFEVKRGEVIGIIGRNGAGKSTLLKVLSRITEPTSGRIVLNGRVGSLLEVGTGFHPELTGRENIFLNGAILGMRRAEIARKFDEIVSFSEVDKFIDTPVKHYSSGMYMRLAFAVAANLEPEILVVDEVLAVGDAEFQKKCLGKMQEVSHGGRTVLFVSHNMAAIQKLCSQVVVMEKGRVAFHGATLPGVQKYSDRQGLQGRSIIDYAKEYVEGITLTTVTANDSTNDTLELAHRERDITITVTGIASKTMRLDIEGNLEDWSGAVIGHFCPARQNGQISTVAPGPFTLATTLTLPALNQGDFFLSFWLSDPKFVGYWDFPKALKMTLVGQVLATGDVLSASNKGSLLIDSRTLHITDPASKDVKETENAL